MQIELRCKVVEMEQYNLINLETKFWYDSRKYTAISVYATDEKLCKKIKRIELYIIILPDQYNETERAPFWFTS